MTKQEIVSALSKKKHPALYVLAGEESFFIDEIEQLFIQLALDAADKDFNQHVLFAKDITASEVVKLAQQFPMMAEKQLILVKEAQNYKDLEVFKKYLKKPLESTILVLSFKGKKVDKTFSDKFPGAAFFESKLLYENQLPAFIEKLALVFQFKIDGKTATMLAEYLGNDLAKIHNEISKLKVLLPPNSVISEKIIEENIGISKEYNVYELITALALRDKVKASKIAYFMGQNEKANPFVIVLGQLFGFYNKVLNLQFLTVSNPAEQAKALKVKPYFLKDYQVAAAKYSRRELAEKIHLLAEYDLKSKGVGNASADDAQLLQELSFKLLL